MRRIKDEELRKYQEEVGQMEYRKTSIYFCNLSKRIRQNNLRASREHYENSEERLNEIKEKYKNGVTMDILNEMFNVEIL